MVLYGGGTYYQLSFQPIINRHSNCKLAAVFGPAASAWYGVLQRHIVFKSYAATIATRVAADQALFTPTHLFCFLTSMSIMEGSDPWEKLRNGFWPTFKTNVGVWSTVQAINFSVVPLEYRVLVVNVVSLGEFDGRVFLRFH